MFAFSPLSSHLAQLRVTPCNNYLCVLRRVDPAHDHEDGQA